MKRTFQALIIALVAVAGGLHLPALQVVAWTGMLVGNTGEHGLSEAVSRTFDGEHPCCLCEFIADAEQSGEDEPERIGLDVVSFKLIPVQLVRLLPPARTRAAFCGFDLRFAGRGELPAVPPPRLV